MTCCIKITINSYYTAEKYSRTMNEKKKRWLQHRGRRYVKEEFKEDVKVRRGNKAGDSWGGHSGWKEIRIQ